MMHFWNELMERFINFTLSDLIVYHIVCGLFLFLVMFFGYWMLEFSAYYGVERYHVLFMIALSIVQIFLNVMVSTERFATYRLCVLAMLFIHALITAIGFFVCISAPFNSDAIPALLVSVPQLITVCILLIRVLQIEKKIL